MTALKEIRDGWDQAAREDAMFNILTDPSKQGGGWDSAEFFAHGQREIDAVMERVECRKGRALDFGCGIGRLTQALAHHFKRVDGVDISPEMVDRAKSHNLHPGRVEYHLNTERLPFRAGTFNFVYSMIVLQHMPQALQAGYVAEFLRVLKPTGVTMFQIPEGSDYQHGNGWLSMHCADRPTIEGWVDSAGGKVTDAEMVGTDGGFTAFRYTAVRA